MFLVLEGICGQLYLINSILVVRQNDYIIYSSKIRTENYFCLIGTSVSQIVGNEQNVLDYQYKGRKKFLFRINANHL